MGSGAARRPARDTAGARSPFDKADGRTDGEWRLYARSTSDDKAPIVGVLAALDALRAAGIPPSVNLKLFFEGEEEAGSPHLQAMLARHADRLTADVWLFCDGPVHQSRRLQVFFGVRGVMGLEMTVYGPLRALHSGHYGNWAPNPAVTLAHLVASLRDTDGRILVAGFYDDVRPLSDTERARALAAVPDVDQALRDELALGATEAAGALAERILLPALNVRGLLVRRRWATRRPTRSPPRPPPPSTSASSPTRRRQKVRARVEAHLAGAGLARRARGARRVRRGAGTRGWSGWSGSPATRRRAPRWTCPCRARWRAWSRSRWARRWCACPPWAAACPCTCSRRCWARRSSACPSRTTTTTQHAANENLRLQNLWDGIEVYAGLIARLGPALE